MHPLRVVSPPPRMQSCYTASLCASSCRPPAKSCPMRCTSTMPPAVSLPVSPRKSLLPEKVQPLPHIPLLRPGPASSYHISNIIFSLSSGYPEAAGWSHRAPGCAKLTAKCCGECRLPAPPPPPARLCAVAPGALLLPGFWTFHASHLHLSPLQGAGEPMDLGELVGMTPEIIQKVGCAFTWWEC